MTPHSIVRIVFYRRTYRSRRRVSKGISKRDPDAMTLAQKSSLSPAYVPNAQEVRKNKGHCCPTINNTDRAGQNRCSCGERTGLISVMRIGQHQLPHPLCYCTPHPHVEDSVRHAHSVRHAQCAHHRTYINDGACA
jgi:hypothetical protein